MARTLQMSNKWQKILKIGDIIDAKDTDDIWYRATIIASTCNDTMFRVHFHGWTTKWIDSIPRYSVRIAPAYDKVPDWKSTIEIGSFIEAIGNVKDLDNPTNYTWAQGMVTDIAEDGQIEVNRSNRTFWVDKYSWQIAELYTHTGYSGEPTGSERRRMLNLRRSTYYSKINRKKMNEKNNIQSKVGKSLKIHLNDKTLSDVEIIIHKKKIYAHKIILCARSEYFRKMFDSGMKESKTNQIYIFDTTYDTYLEFLEYIYTGDVNKIKNEKKLYDLANMYCLDELKHIIKDK